MQRASGPTLIFASEGVYFSMEDHAKHPVRFIVTRGALAHLMGRPISIPEAEQAFYAHRAVIEAAASRKFATRGALRIKTTIDALDVRDDQHSLRAATERTARKRR